MNVPRTYFPKQRWASTSGIKHLKIEILFKSSLKTWLIHSIARKLTKIKTFHEPGKESSLSEHELTVSPLKTVQQAS